MQYKNIIIIVILLGLLLTSGFLYTRVESQAETIGELSINLKDATDKITAMETLVRDFMAESESYNRDANEIAVKLAERVDSLQTNIQRGKKAIDAKPKLVEKLIQKDYKEFSSRMDCITLGKCEK